MMRWKLNSKLFVVLTTMVQSRHLTIAVLLPLVVLVGDFITHPVLFKSRKTADKIVLSSLVESEYLPLGNLRNHRVSILFDKVRDTQKRPELNGHRGIVISAFVDQEGEVGISELGRAAIERIATTSDRERIRLSDFLRNCGTRSVGEVVPYKLDLPENDSFPYSHLLIVLLPSNISDNDKLLESELEKIIKQSGTLKLDSLTVPAFGYSWWDRNCVKLDFFYSSALKSLDIGEYPKEYVFNFYFDWPTFVLENAARSFNIAWEDAWTGPTKFFHFKLRLVSLLTSLCVFRVLWHGKRKLSIVSYCVVITFYVSCCSGISDGLKLFLDESGLAYDALLAVALCFVAFFFVPITKLLQEGLFKDSVKP